VLHCVGSGLATNCSPIRSALISGLRFVCICREILIGNRSDGLIYRKEACRVFREVKNDEMNNTENRHEWKRRLTEGKVFFLRGESRVKEITALNVWWMAETMGGVGNQLTRTATFLYKLNKLIVPLQSQLHFQYNCSPKITHLCISERSSEYMK
jgi:hypothetical protein